MSTYDDLEAALTRGARGAELTECVGPMARVVAEHHGLTALGIDEVERGARKLCNEWVAVASPETMDDPKCLARLIVTCTKGLCGLTAYRFRRGLLPIKEEP